MNDTTKWEDTLTKIWSRAHIPDFASDAKFAIENLIASELFSQKQAVVEMVKEKRANTINMGACDALDDILNAVKEI